MGFIDILQQYADSKVAPTGEVFSHFDTVAQQAPTAAVGSGVAAAMRSNATPAFSQIVGNLFGQSSPEQKAGVLNEILRVAGPASFGNGILTRLLGTQGPPATVTPSQAAQVPAEEVSTAAANAERQNSGIVDQLGAFYAQHPTLVKTLGVAALGIVMSHMNGQRKL